MIAENIKSEVVGVDISIETTTYAIVDVRGNILAEDSFPTIDYPDVNKFVAELSEKIIELVEANGGYERIRSIGMSSPSASSVSGCIENAANLPWKGIVPMAAMLRDRLGLAVALSNDAHVSALGEYTFGSGQTMWDIWGLQVSSDIPVSWMAVVRVVVAMRVVWRLMQGPQVSPAQPVS